MTSASLHTYALDTVTRIGMVSGLLLVAAGLVAIAVYLVKRYRDEVADTDVKLRRQGHVPAEVDSEITTVMRAVERDLDLDHGKHSTGSMHVRSLPYRGKHHQRIGCLTVAALQRRLAVPA